MSEINKYFREDSKDMFRAFGDTLHTYAGDPDLTFQRDIQLFMYGRFMILNSLVQGMSDGKEAFTMADVAYNLGSCYASMIHSVIDVATENGETVKEGLIEMLAKQFEKLVVDGMNDKLKILAEGDNDNTTLQ